MNGLFILTSPRRGNVEPFAYLGATLEHVKREGFVKALPRHILVDGNEDDQRAVEELAGRDWAVHRHEHGVNWLGGNKWPYWKLLRVALEVTPKGDEAVVLEDDLQFCTNAVRRMLLLGTPDDVDALQFFSAWLFRQPNTIPGLWRTPALMQGCQALKFPRRTLELLCGWADEDPEWQKHNESDVSLGLAQQRLDLRFANHMPDLVQHVGHSSLVSHGMNEEAGIVDPEHVALSDRSLPGRVSVNFSARFDAMKLFARHELYR